MRVIVTRIMIVIGSGVFNKTVGAGGERIIVTRMMMIGSGFF